MADDEIKIEFSKSEALVLFEFVSRYSDNQILEIRNPAEERVLWAICCSLESILAEPFAENYADLLARAGKDVLSE